MQKENAKISQRITFRDFYRLSERRKRISIDLDAKKIGKFDVLRVFFSLKQMFPNCSVKVERTRHGFHVKAVGDAIEQIPIAKRIDIRRSLGDDLERIERDLVKIEHGQDYLVDTLFSMKIDYDRTITIAEEINPIALPWIPFTPQSFLTEKKLKSK